MSVFGELERIAADLYPYRWPITIGLGIAVLFAVWFALRQGWHLTVWRHKAVSGLALAATLVVAVPAVDYLVSPLWERSFLDEASPLAATSRSSGEVSGPDGSINSPELDGTLEPGATLEESPVDGTPGGGETSLPDPGETAFEPLVTRRGEVTGADDFHFGRGTALLIETAPDTYTLRLEDFSVRNGPDLFVYLTPQKDSVDGGLNLGDLKATDGAFNYEVPPGTDTSQYQYAIVWCRQFSVLFASASLQAAS